jgi:hypothetical protein
MYLLLKKRAIILGGIMVVAKPSSTRLWLSISSMLSMDDYTRSVNTNRTHPGAALNGDTAVRSLSEVKRKYARPLTDPAFGEEFDWERFNDEYQFGPDDEHYFNITEDWNMDVYVCIRMFYS